MKSTEACPESLEETMHHSHRHLRWALSVMLCSSALAAGCQSVRGVTQQPPPTVAPPLSTPPSDVVHAGGVPAVAAPPQLADLQAPAPRTAIIPPDPHQWTPTTTHAEKPVQTAAATSANPVSVASRPAADDCLPSEPEWRRQMEEQTTELQKRFTQVEGDLATTREKLQNVTQSLQASQLKIERLNQEVVHWKGEVKRLEEDMKAQQLADLKSLDELTESMHQVLLRQQAQAAPRQAGKK
ncbi:hypothetical protein SH661x_000553 [Planctomicrobium sp. SH661]|uniref:hypothetical protein n=1 Tax=Planctomicrobium sp. SH661 TaxID=3448124 RepID=UPI003F5C97D1